MTGGQYIRLTADEIAALIVGGEDVEEMGGDIIVCKLDGNLQRIYIWHSSFLYGPTVSTPISIWNR